MFSVDAFLYQAAFPSYHLSEWQRASCEADMPSFKHTHSSAIQDNTLTGTEERKLFYISFLIPAVTVLLPVSFSESCWQSHVSLFASTEWVLQENRAAPPFQQHVAEPGTGAASLSILVQRKAVQCLVAVSAQLSLVACVLSVQFRSSRERLLVQFPSL